MNPIGLDIGTNYTKATKDGEEVTIFPSIVAYGEEKDWSLKGEEKEVYVGEEALAIVQSLENVEAMRPLHEGRLMHQSYMELARHALKVLETNPDVVATGLPVKSSKNEREALARDLKEQLKIEPLIFPEPVGTLAHLGIDTGVCVDIGFGTTDIVVLSHMEYLRGDTLLVGVDWLYENIEVLVRNSVGISITPEELTKLLTTDCEVGRVRSGKRITISQKDVSSEYDRLMKSWIERIVSRTKLILEGLSTTIVDRLVLTGGGSLLPGVYEEFSKSFEEVAKVIRPDDPVTSNAKGYYALARVLFEEKGKEVERAPEKGKEESKKKGKVKKGEVPQQSE